MGKPGNLVSGDMGECPEERLVTSADIGQNCAATATDMGADALGAYHATQLFRANLLQKTLRSRESVNDI